MKSDEVLERAERHLELSTKHNKGFCGCRACEVVRDLAAALREAREDTKRLDFVLANYSFARRGAPLLPDWAAGDRVLIDHAIDAACAAGGEG